MNSSSKYVMAVATVTLAIACGILFKLLESTATQDLNNVIDDQQYGEVLNRLADLQNQVARLDPLVQSQVEPSSPISTEDKRKFFSYERHIEASSKETGIAINLICEEDAGLRPISINITCFDSLLEPESATGIKGSLTVEPETRIVRPLIKNVSDETIAINQVSVTYNNLGDEDEPGFLESHVYFRCEPSNIAPSETKSISCEQTHSYGHYRGENWTWHVGSVSVFAK